ncbi:MAG: SusD/RagB family nutrient-binding outer membrane lipoprotein [Bacteroidota bacterium]
MKKTIIKISLVAALFATGCTKKFDALNTDPTQASASNFDANLLLPSGELGYVGATTGYSGPILFQSMWVQTFASAIYPGYYSNGDKYVQGGSYLSYQASTWNGAYQAASYLREAQNLIKGNAAQVNLSGIAKTLELLNIEAVTDVYGDIPFSQALQAKAGLSQPLYDKQQDIYNSMLAKLDSVLPTLDASKAKPTNDATSYKGDVTLWKKFGYSLMLRMAMRLTKVDAVTAKKYAEKAFASGVFTSNADNLYLVYDNTSGFHNNNTAALTTGEDYSEVKWGKVLIDYLKTTADPRLSIIAEVPKNGVANTANQKLAGDPTAINQQGMPNGYDQNGGATDISHAPAYPGASPADPTTNTSTYTDQPNVTGRYSRPTTALYLSLNAPTFILTYAQTEFLLAEAAVRGWSVGSAAAVHYNNAIVAALTTLGTFAASGAILPATATIYAAAHPLDVTTTANSLQQINTQYWVFTSSIFEFDEAWSNWRRSGYPVLTPVVYPGNFTNATIPRRQSYPTGEASANPANYKTAVSSLTGGDVYTGRVWWDK